MTDRGVISASRSWCPDCGLEHRCEYRRKGETVLFWVDCPLGCHEVTVSSDANLFLQFREKARFLPGEPPAFPLRPRLADLEITDACDTACPICYAGAGVSPTPWFMELPEVERRGRALAAAGGKWVFLTGGEPTCHPLLKEILHLLRRGCGLSPVVITNGIRVGRDFTYLASLKASGLRKMGLQFDTFRPDVFEAMRGRTRVEEKVEAARAIIAAGLRLGLVTTVTRLNLDEVGDILDFAISLMPRVNTMLFQSAVPVGRFPKWAGSVVDREEIIQSLARGCKKSAFSPADFFPLPTHRAWGLAAHPDCGATMVLTRDGEDVSPMTRTVDMGLLYGNLRSSVKGKGFVGSTLSPMVQLLRSTDRKKRLRLLSSLWGLVKGKGPNPSLVVTAGTFMYRGFRDEERLERCSACTLSARGPTSVCGPLSLGQGRPDMTEVSAR